MKLNEKYLLNPYTETGRALIENATHTVEETQTINGEKLEYNKYVFADGSDVVECGSILDTEKEFLSIQSHYDRDCEEIGYKIGDHVQLNEKAVEDDESLDWIDGMRQERNLIKDLYVRKEVGRIESVGSPTSYGYGKYGSPTLCIKFGKNEIIISADAIDKK